MILNTGVDIMIYNKNFLCEYCISECRKIIISKNDNFIIYIYIYAPKESR